MSKVEKRGIYDNARRQVTHRSNISSGPGFTHSAVSDSMYATQKANYAVIAKEAGSHWKTVVDKYKTEKWINMPLKDKKVFFCGSSIS